jgi:hypothetical protein
MTREALPALPPAFAAKRDALHRLAVHVISPAQRLSKGEIILRATPGGFSTFGFGGRTVGVAGAELVVDGVRHPIGSLNDTARLVGSRPTSPSRSTYGASPGDRHDPDPYLYASPWAGRIDAFFDAPGFKGAARPRSELAATGDPRGAAVEFLRAARGRVRRTV